MLIHFSLGINVARKTSDRYFERLPLMPQIFPNGVEGHGSSWRKVLVPGTEGFEIIHDIDVMPLR